jgi:hypothetical protein
VGLFHWVVVAIGRGVGFMDSDKLNVDVGISYAYCRICKNIIS